MKSSSRRLLSGQDVAYLWSRGVIQVEMQWLWYFYFNFVGIAFTFTCCFFFISIAGSGAVIARSSQPLVGLMMNMRRYIEISILLLDLCMIIWFLIWILKVLEVVDSEVWYIYFTHFYSTSDEKLVTSFCTQLAGHKGSRRWASDFFVVWVQLTFRFTDDLFVIS